MKKEALKALHNVFFIFEEHCKNFDIDMPDDLDGQIIDNAYHIVRTALQNQPAAVRVEELMKRTNQLHMYEAGAGLDGYEIVNYIKEKHPNGIVIK